MDTANIEIAKTPKPTLHTFSLTVEINHFWVEYLTQYNDIFRSSSAGYWLRGVENDPDLGWLCWEDDEKHRWRNEPGRQGALKAWRENKPLPAHWFRIDRAAALRAWEEGVKRWGVDWYDQADASREDTVVQLALLGEVKYG